MGTFVAGRDIPPVGLTWPAADSHDIPALERLRDLVRSLRVHAEEVADLVGGPLRCVARVEWSSRWQDDVVRSAEALMRGAGALTEAAAAFVQKGGLPPTAFDGRRVAGLRSLAAVLPRAAGKDWRFMLRPDAVRVVADLGRGSALVQQHTEVAARLSVPYRPAATELDLSRLRASWRDAAASWWPMSYFRRRPVRAALIGVSLGERPFDVASDLDRLTELQSLESDMEQLSHLAARTEGLWEGLGTSADEASAAIAFHRDLTDALAVLATDGDTLATFHGALERLLGQGNALLGPNGEVAAAASALEDAAASNDRSVDGFTSLASTTREDLLALTDGTLADLAVLCEGVINDARHLHRWCAWRKVRSDALVVGLGPLLDALESGVVPSAALAEAFDVAYCRWWLGEVVDQDDLLRTFLSAEHERLIEDFRRADARFMELTGAIIRARLCADMPVQEGVKKSSEWGVLRRELEKKRRHLPVRELISRMPTAFPKLAPCLLMSPLSIAQYLSAETATFDVVIFDEASQIPVWDAIGAIARGRQVVMVGDPKQLPPTNFFQRGEEEPDSEVDEDGDLESILDECLGANVPTSRLSWHYRSRHESLIAFSNHRYYDGGLVTFPSPQTRDRAVRLQFVEEGVYGRGGPRTNLPEARALVSEIVARLRDPEFVASGFTVGIVTFNAEQQGLIQDLLDEERRKDPSIEGFFSESLLEPLFVKNLENVQGDERDVILFSVTYGPDAAGVVSVNFGPLNKDGGERRLNVAVTRARHELLVFASLHPEQIDLSRTQARGVSDFKHFLEFAEKGPRALVEAVIGSQGDFESPFEQAVSKALAGRGWQVNPQVGVSSFRIDLAVVDPDSPGRYLAGIECDGATYHRSATARDRDKIREQVLRGLGWEILRIWSTDWWHDAEGALDRVHGRLQALLEATRARVEETPGVEASARVADGEPLGVREGVADDRVTEALPEVVADRPAAPDEAPSDEAPSDEAPSDEAPSDEAPSDEAPSDQAPSDQAPSDQAPSDQATPPAFFTEADPLSVVPEVDAQAFDHAVYDSVLALMITHVIDVEGPIRDDVLARRIARAHGWQRTGSRIRERVLTLARTLRETTSEDVGVFHWPAGTDPLLPMRFRPPQPGASRSVDEVALPELEALARTILAHRLDRYQSIRLMAGDLGMRSVSRPARLRLSLAYQRVSQPPRSAT
jgi:very-short-patch-repair endonuclease